MKTAEHGLSRRRAGRDRPACAARLARRQSRWPNGVWAAALAGAVCLAGCGRQTAGPLAAAKAETVLGYAVIAAPFDGVITRKLANLGDLASPGRALVDLEDSAALRPETGVPEALQERVRLGTTMAVRVAGLTNPLEGVLAEIAPAANPNSRTVVVKMDLPAAPELPAGQFGRVAVPVGETTLPRVPFSAVVVRGEMEMVFVVTDRTAHLRLLKTGRRHDDQVELLSGIMPGEEVVVEGVSWLAEGQRAEIQRPKSEGRTKAQAQTPKFESRFLAACFTAWASNRAEQGSLNRQSGYGSAPSPLSAFGLPL